MIKDNVFSEHKDFTIEPATVVKINKLIKYLNPKKATEPNNILVKIIKLATNIIYSHLRNLINNGLSRNLFFDSAKVASVRPIFTKGDKTNTKNYRPVSLPNCLSKIYVKFLNENLLHFINHSLSDFMSAYRKRYSTNHALIRLIENWRKALHNFFYSGSSYGSIESV